MFKPCPFCDSYNIEISVSTYRYGIETWANGNITYDISCNNCGAKSGVSYTKDDAIKNWNRRSGEISVQKLNHKITICKEG